MLQIGVVRAGPRKARLLGHRHRGCPSPRWKTLAGMECTTLPGSSDPVTSGSDDPHHDGGNEDESRPEEDHVHTSGIGHDAPPCGTITEP
jgi:hypothetical protein